MEHTSLSNQKMYIFCKIVAKLYSRISYHKIFTEKSKLCFYNTLRKIPQFHRISWCENFAKRHSFPIVSGESPETMRKLCLSAKFPRQEIKLNYGIFPSDIFILWNYIWVKVFNNGPSKICGKQCFAVIWSAILCTETSATRLSAMADISQNSLEKHVWQPHF